MEPPKALELRILFVDWGLDVEVFVGNTEKQCEWKVRTLVPHWFDAEKRGVALVPL